MQLTRKPHPWRWPTALILALVTQVSSADLTVLQYHHISATTPAATSTTPELFESQLQTIANAGLEVVELEAGTRAALAGELNETQQVAITFDDAYRSVLDVAVPLLQQRQWPFTIFINTEAVGASGHLSWPELAELARQPGVTLANHSHDHGHLVRRPQESHTTWRQRVDHSLDTAQRTLEQELGQTVPLFAYPYGEFSAELEELLETRGWLAYGQHSGAIGEGSGRTRLPRFPMANRYGQPDALPDKLHSRAFPLDHAELPDGVVESNPPTLALALPDAFDANRLGCFASGQGRIAVEQTASDVRIQAAEPFTSRRFRYNCTYPAGNGRFFWLSQPWLDLTRPED